MSEVRVPRGNKRLMTVIIGYRSANNRFMTRIVPLDIVVRDGSTANFEVALSASFSSGAPRSPSERTHTRTPGRTHARKRGRSR